MTLKEFLENLSDATPHDVAAAAAIDHLAGYWHAMFEAERLDVGTAMANDIYILIRRLDDIASSMSAQI